MLLLTYLLGEWGTGTSDAGTPQILDIGQPGSSETGAGTPGQSSIPPSRDEMVAKNKNRPAAIDLHDLEQVNEATKLISNNIISYNLLTRFFKYFRNWKKYTRKVKANRISSLLWDMQS